MFGLSCCLCTFFFFLLYELVLKCQHLYSILIKKILHRISKLIISTISVNEYFLCIACHIICYSLQKPPQFGHHHGTHPPVYHMTNNCLNQTGVCTKSSSGSTICKRTRIQDSSTVFLLPFLVNKASSWLPNSMSFTSSETRKEFTLKFTCMILFLFSSSGALLQSYTVDSSSSLKVKQHLQ